MNTGPKDVRPAAHRCRQNPEGRRGNGGRHCYRRNPLWSNSRNAETRSPSLRSTGHGRRIFLVPTLGPKHRVRARPRQCRSGLTRGCLRVSHQVAFTATNRHARSGECVGLCALKSVVRVQQGQRHVERAYREGSAGTRGKTCMHPPGGKRHRNARTGRPARH